MKSIGLTLTGDPWLDVLATALSQAFKQAEKSGARGEEARRWISSFVSPAGLRRLRAQGYISWDPSLEGSKTGE